MRQTYRLSGERVAAISQAAGLESEDVRHWCLDEMAEVEQDDAVEHQRWLDETPVADIARWLAERTSAFAEWQSAQARGSRSTGYDDSDDDEDE